MGETKKARKKRDRIRGNRRGGGRGGGGGGGGGKKKKGASIGKEE